MRCNQCGRRAPKAKQKENIRDWSERTGWVYQAGELHPICPTCQPLSNRPRHPHYQHIPDATEIAVARAKYSNWDWWNDE
jgi:hypothetical protein